jgi:O-acetyl-ADP-ribose deacetylase (regulator of RNase III)
MLLSPPSKSVPVSTSRKKDSANPSNVSMTEKLHGSLELSLGDRNLTVKIKCADISKETTELIMHVMGQDFSFGGGVAKALIKAGGDSIVQECKSLGKPALFSTQYTNAGNLAARQIAHVIAPATIKIDDLQKCVDAFFDDVSKRNIGSVSLSAIGAGAMGYSESQSADLIFDNLSRIAKNKNSSLNLVRIVIFDNAKFIKFKHATKAYFASVGAIISNPSPQPSKGFSRPKILRSLTLRRLKKQKSNSRNVGVSIRIYSDSNGKIDKAWGELLKKMNENIKQMTTTDDVIKKFTDDDFKKMRELERDFDLEIKVDQGKGEVKFKGHIHDIASVQGKINEILNDIKDNKSKGKILLY